MLDASIHNLSIRGDRQVGLSYLPEAEKVLRMLQDRMRLGGVQTCSQFKKLSETDYCHVMVAGDVNTISIVAESSSEPTYLYDDFIEISPPSIMSGVATRSLYTIDNDGVTQMNGYYPTTNTQELFELPPGRQQSARLAINKHDDVQTTAKILPSGKEWPPHAGIKPTMYTGKMKKVVQAIYGIGFLPDRDIYYESRLRRKNELEPEKPSPYYEEVRSFGYQIRYDYTWFKSHGISMGLDAKPWLVEISAGRGAVAMPLPLHPESLSEEYFAKALDLQDDAVLACINEFGGIPSGESFPKGAQLDAMIRSGQALVLAEQSALQPFYDTLDSYSSACGWAFSESGREAHNTGWMDTPSGQIGEHFSLSIQIGAVREETSAEFAAAVEKSFRGYMQSLGYYRFKAAISKLKRLNEEEVAQQNRLIRILSADRYMAYLDELVVEPIAPFTSMFARSGSGNLWGVGTVGAWQLKFWEPNFNEERVILSHNFGNHPVKSCDTTVFVYFEGETLKCVKFFKTIQQEDDNTTESTEVECMFEGEWYTENRDGGGSVTIGYYSEDFDDRREYRDSFVRDTLTSTFMGHTGLWGQDYFGSYSENGYGNCFYSPMYLRTNKREVVGSETLMTAVVCMPAYTREAFFYASREVKTAITETVTHSYLPGSNGYRIKYNTFHGPATNVPGPFNIYRVCSEYEPLGDNFSCLPEQRKPPLFEVGDEVLERNLAWGYWGSSTLFPGDSFPPLPENTSKAKDIEGLITVRLGWFGGTRLVAAYNADSDPAGFNRASMDWFEPSPQAVAAGFLLIGRTMSQWMTANSFGQLNALCYQSAPDGAVEVVNADGPEYSAQPCFIGVLNGD